MNKTFVVIGLIVILLVGGYYTYEYLKQKPPNFLIGLLTKTDPPPPLPSGPEAPLTAPEGFIATIFSREVPGARVMTRDQNGTMLVSLTESGKVVALPDADGNGEADSTITVLEGLRQPHGIVVKCEGEDCRLYVAETHQLRSYTYNAETHTASDGNTLATFPSGEGHYTRTLLEHPDGESLFISIGSSCNVCDEEELLRATVQRIDLTTNELTTVATGLRNTVFMALNPVDGSVWGTDNGRDVIGDDIPPDEVNVIENGSDYGWPVCYGQNVADTDFESSKGSDCPQSTPALIDLPAHVAALGLAFIPEEGWPDTWGHDLLIAYHGSWNRSEPSGYKVVRIELTEDGRYEGGSEQDFLTGFLAAGADEDDAIGRPVGVLAKPGGIAYISDDRAGAIYMVQRVD